MAHYRRVCHLIGLLLLTCATSPSNALKCPTRRALPGQHIICYTRSEDVAHLEDAICRCTIIVHQGHDLRGLDASGLRRLQNIRKEANPDLKVVMAINDKYNLLKKSVKMRHRVAVNLTEILKQVDGVELNITAGNKDRLNSFITDLKDEIAKKKMEKLILLALPTKAEDLAKQFELKELSKYVDVFTVSTHYLKDSEETYRTFHPSRLMGLFDMLNSDSLVDLITGMGAPKNKIVISVPASAYKFTLRKAENNTPRSLTLEPQPVVLNRKKLCDSMSVGEWTVERDEDLTAPYAFQNTTWIAFEDETSLKIKGKYVILRDLAGIGIRDVENDLKNNCGKSVIQSVYQAFMDMKRKSRAIVLSSLEKDLKGTEIAYPRHVRSSDFRIVRVVDIEGKIRAVRENTQTAFTCTRQGYFVHPKSCNRFYRCVKFNQEIEEYSVFEFDCPAGLAFDERTEVCVWPGSVSKGSACPGSSEIEPVPRSRFRCPSQPGFYADPQNCRWFFACYDLGGSEMVPYEFRCPFGLVFDEHKLICEWPWKVPNCNTHEHSNKQSVYHFGNYEPQEAYISQERANGPNYFVGQTTYPGQHVNFGDVLINGQKSNIDSINNGFNKYIYNQTGDFSSLQNNGQNYNGHNLGLGAYDELSYNVDYDSKIHGKNNGADGVKSVFTYGEPNYNPAITSQNGAGYAHNYDGNGDAGTGINYDGNSNENSGIGFNGVTYHSTKSPIEKPTHNTHNYNEGDTINPEENYNGKNNNGDHTVKPIIVYGQSYNPVNNPQNKNEYDYNYNANDGTGINVNYDSNIHNVPTVGKTYLPVNNPDLTKGYLGPNYNPGNTIPATGNSDGFNYNTQGSNGAGIDYNPQTYNYFGNNQPDLQKSPPFITYNYDGSFGNVGGTGEDCDGQVAVPEINYQGQNYNPYGTGYVYEPNQGYPGIIYNNPIYPNPEIVYGYGVNTNTNHDQNNKDHKNTGTTKSDDCDNQSNIPKNAEGDKKDSTYHNDRDKTTPFNSGDSVTTAGINNLNTGTHATTKFTDDTVNYSSGSGLNTGYSTGSTSGYPQSTIHPYTSGSTGYGEHVTSTHSPSTVKTSQTGLSSTEFDKTDIYGVTDSPITIGNTHIPSTARPIVYNTSYNIGTGFPTTTIIPYTEHQSTLGHQGTTPVNSMGLTSTDHFGNEYTNEAEKSFTTPGQTLSSSTSHEPTENHPHFNTATNVYDYSKVNLGGVTPAITVIQDDEDSNVQGHNGVTNYKPSYTTNFNYPTETTIGINNSPYFGGSITSSNNDITNFHESTKLPNGFRTHGNTPGSTIPTIVPLSDTKPEIEFDNSGLFGIKIGSSTTAAPETQTPIHQSTTPKIKGYKTNEYHDNGGRGTIRYNNGITATKVTENDIQDYRTSAYTGIPNSFIITSNGENEQSTIQQANTDTNQAYTTGSFTKEGFTKTGPTKTGITTAQVGGSGSYVIGTSPSRAQPNPQYIGEQAFVTNFGANEGTTNLQTSLSPNGFNNNDLLKFDTERPNEFTGYSYPKPAVEFEIKGSTTSMPIKTENTHYDVTTAAPHVDPFYNQNSVIVESNGEHHNDFSTTVAPVTYTTNPLERFKTTIAHISTLPQATSTHKPEIPSDFGTVISSTYNPTNGEKQRHNPHHLSTKSDTFSGISYDQGHDFISTPYRGQTGSSDYSDITSNFDQASFGQKIGGYTMFTNFDYPQSTLNTGEIHHNNELIKSTQDAYNIYTQALDDSSARLEYLRYGRPENLISTTSAPSSTKAPVNRKKPIVAAEFSQKQFDSNEFSQQIPVNKILANQASRNHAFTDGGPSNKILNSDVQNFAPQELNSKNLNNQASAKYISQESSSKLLNNQNTDSSFKTPSNEIISNNAFENSYSGQTQGYNGHTRTLIGSNVITSIGGTVLDNGFIPQNAESFKFISEFNGMNNRNFGATRQSTTSAPEITTYSGQFSRNSLSNSNKEQNKNRNVIVKLSDLHPLILGKLSAECTCKADPFAIFRGSNRQSLPINSQNRGQVDLANYDESEIYVDVDNDKETEMDIELIKNIPSNRIIKPSKIITSEKENNKNAVVKSRGESSSTYLPPLLTSSISTYLPPARPTNTYSQSSTKTTVTPVYRHNQASSGIKTETRQPLLIRVEDNINNNNNNNNNENREIVTARRRSGRVLFEESVKSYNGIRSQDVTNSRLKTGDFKGIQEEVDGSLECARPGLFRHPKFCNKFYACHWDNWKKRYTLHVFNCPVHLAFDTNAGACNFPSKGPACQDNKLLI